MCMQIVMAVAFDSLREAYGEPLVDTPESPVYDAGAGNNRVITSAKFIRVVFYDKSGQGESLIVTINEEI